MILRKALESTGRVAIAKVSLRQKEHLCCLRPFNRGIVMATMYYPDEIRSFDDLELPQEDGLVSDQELAMAETLIDQLTGDFDPAQYQDEYRGSLEKAIEARLASSEPVTAAPVPARGKVVDLMAALRDSIESAKQEAEQKEFEAAPTKAKSASSSAKRKAPARTA